MKPSFHLERLGFGAQQRRVHKLADALDAYRANSAGAPTQSEIEADILDFIDSRPDSEVRHSTPEMVVDAIAILFSNGANPFRQFNGLHNIVDDAIFVAQAQEIRELTSAFRPEAYDAGAGTDVASSLGAVAATGPETTVIDMAKFKAVRNAQEYSLQGQIASPNQ